MRLKYIILLLLTVPLSIVIGCKKLVEVDVPSNQVTTASVFNNDNTAIAAQLSIYAQMLSVPYTLNASTGLSADEFTNFSSGLTYIDLYRNALKAQADGNGLIWGTAFNYIYQENAIIENTRNAKLISPVVRNLLLGEGYFGRAYWYFNLTSLYGDVPLITSTDYKTNTLLARTPRAQVLQQIVSDLRASKTSLSQKYLDATDTTETEDRVRPTTWAASALLSRVYLLSSKYDSAELEASTVINNTSLFSLVDLSSVFLKNSKEAIWQLMPNTSSVSTPDGDGFILIKRPGTTSALENCCSISPQLLNAFDSGDQRMVNWIGSYTDGTSTWSFPNKYKDNSSTSSSLKEYSMVLRIGEQYLNRAEARARQNKLDLAIADINAIRERAGLSDLDPALNQTQVISAVAHERQVELFAEGQRWLDLKRTGAIDSVMSKVSLQKGNPWGTHQQLYPLPLSDIQTAVNLVQNPGY
ncbi:RagB/SusD family nutrient uptake outer membrane protein [Puia sp. P3]|uniref:RagB/SusD family nutrient uptake outer membrane protein n=1 Tax=Puia sp. P3 TaxID=3423952 RepID=UPI003D66AF52